ncbi:hypothetical protein [Evansella halocellulosilytica]|uniref:hypothetical protein n=1 Tax=Evansella halocellulosilytica TaxID=2011013 RepID=UPI0011558E13|nr:hypothetical protein [Evansella halocellulosilytica]
MEDYEVRKYYTTPFPENTTKYSKKERNIKNEESRNLFNLVKTPCKTIKITIKIYENLSGNSHKESA